MSNIKERTVDDIVEALKDSKAYGNSAALLIGAGCSVSAGIPDAKQIVELIRLEYEVAFNRSKEKSYPQCMGELLPGQRRNLIRSVIHRCNSINWAHIGIAQLIQARIVDRILTVNFDPLITKACAIAGEYPAVYDFTARHDYQSGRIAEQAVFHLHGQHTGFVLLNTEKEVQDQAEIVRPVIQDASANRTWIIVGYSGANDPVFDELANIGSFDHGLFWVGHGKEDPAPHVRRLLEMEGAYFVRDYDADRFFIELCQKLGCFPPSLVRSPFSHLKKLLDSLTEFPVSGGETVDILGIAKGIVERNANLDAQLELGLKAADLFARRDYSELQELVNANEVKDVKARELAGWSYINEGLALLGRAKADTSARADELFAQANDKFGLALVTNPKMHEALNNWGNSLLTQARKKSGDEADALFVMAYDKFSQALAIQPSKYQTFNNWGNALSGQAVMKVGETADALFAQSYDKYSQAFAIKPDGHEVLQNWGMALSDQARTKMGVEAEALFAQAYYKYERALQIKPDKTRTLQSWADALLGQARTKTGAEADALFDMAYAKYAQALSIDPNIYRALQNWGNALSEQAQTKVGAEFDVLIAQVYDKYERAVAIKPDADDIFNSWGVDLSKQAETKTGGEAQALLEQAFEKYEQAFVINPKRCEALRNWGGALTIQAMLATSSSERFMLLIEARNRTLRAYQICPGESAYSLSRVYALIGHAANTLKFLIESKSSKEIPSKSFIDADFAFDEIRRNPEIQRFISELPDRGALKI